MTDAEIRSLIIAALSNIAPDMDVAAVKPEADLREALDIDSMDVLNFITALHAKTGLDIPERDYPKLLSLAGAETYIAQHQKPL